MSQKSDEKKALLEAIRRFLANLRMLSTGDRAILRRCAGQPMQRASIEARNIFLCCLPFPSAVHQSQYDKWFAIACFVCMWDPKARVYAPVEKMIAQGINLKKLPDSLKHRINVLLATKWSSNGYLVYKLYTVLYMVRRTYEMQSPDFSKLLQDLLWWNSANQYAQQSWQYALYDSKYNLDLEDEGGDEDGDEDVEAEEDREDEESA